MQRTVRQALLLLILCAGCSDNSDTKEEQTSSPDAGFAIYDIADASKPTLLGRANTPQGMAHTVWPSEDGTHVFVTDEILKGHLTIWNITDPSTIVKVADYQPNVEAIIHNAEVVGNRAYISYYNEGVKVLDISDPAKPHEVGSYDMYEGPDFDKDEDPEFPDISRMNGAWGVDSDYPRVYVSAIESGLWIFEMTDK